MRVYNSKIISVIALIMTASGGANAQWLNRPVVDSSDPIGMESGLDTSSIDTLPQKIAQRARKDLKEVREKGYMTVPDEVVDGFALEVVLPHIGDINEISKNLAVAPYSIDGTPFSELMFHGTVATSAGADGQVTGITRVFSQKNKTMLTLEEWDYVTSDGLVAMHEEFVNESVNGYPAIITIRKNSKGRATSSIQWAKDEKLSTLTMSGHIRGNGHRNKLVAYAESLY